MTGREHNIGSCNRKRGQKLRFYPAAAAFFLAMLFGLSSLQAQPKHPHQQRKEDAKRQVEKLEETWRIAQLNGDAETMDRLLSEDYIGITMNGQVVTKMQQLDRMRNRTLSLTKIELDDVKVKLIGQTAVVTSRADVEGTNDGEPVHGTYRYTRVYTRAANGSWKITNFEATRVGGPPAPRRARGLAPPRIPDNGGAAPAQKLVAGTSGK